MIDSDPLHIPPPTIPGQTCSACRHWGPNCGLGEAEEHVMLVSPEGVRWIPLGVARAQAAKDGSIAVLAALPTAKLSACTEGPNWLARPAQHWCGSFSLAKLHMGRLQS